MSDKKPSDDANSQRLGNVLDGLLHEIDAASAGVNPLPGHPGRGRDTLENGRSRLWVKGSMPDTRSEREAAVWEIAKEQYEKGQVLCESPIERSLLGAVLTADWGYFGTENALVHNPNDVSEEFPEANVVVVPQLRIGRYRVDFALVLRAGPRRQVFALECDGKEFHNAAADRDRDFYLQSYGVITHRFSGSDLNRRPLASIDEFAFGVYHWWEAAFN
jgi:hypothetical protein